MNSLYHAYVVGGARADARAHIETLLKSQSIAVQDNPDFFVQEFVAFSVDDARAIRGWQELMPVGERKVSVIYTDFINNEAQNALLKTFEEPIANTHIFLAVPKPELLLPTLLSRVQILTPIASNEASIEASEFVQMNLSQRMQFIAKLAEKSEDDDASAQVREKAVSFLDGLEQLLAKDPQKNQKSLEQILKFKKYLYVSGSSVKMILEAIALAL
jgi:hypothetical protein